MHYGKYVGRLSKLLRDETTSNDIKHEVKRTLVDCFIIVLSCADLLHLRLDDKLKENLKCNNTQSLKELIICVKKESPDLYSKLSTGDDKNKIFNLILEYSPLVGDLLKVGEDLDHMVGFDRDIIRNHTLGILNIVLLSSLIWDVDLENEVPKRWQVLANRTKIEGPQ